MIVGCEDVEFNFKSDELYISGDTNRGQDQKMMGPKLLKLNFTPPKLTNEQKIKLNNLGYLILPNIIDFSWRQELFQSFENTIHLE